MKYICLCVCLLCSCFYSKADDIVETYNIVDDGYEIDVQDVPIVRPINGGTVILPDFDSSCPEECMLPFSYACKIVEEYMPPCLPLRVKVSFAQLSPSVNGAISRVICNTKENFGRPLFYNNSPMSTIKGVILGEKMRSSTVTFLDSVPNLAFLTDNYDFEIIYNLSRVDEMSFSLNPDPENNYDFISLAIRDILKGLGVLSSFRCNSNAKELYFPSSSITPFESAISSAFGYNSNPGQRYQKATSGALSIGNSSVDLKLYAPQEWQQGLSLNTFIPSDSVAISKALRYDFKKGMVTRSLWDSNAGWIFENQLGWIINFTVGSNDYSANQFGDTSIKLPYDGSLNIEDIISNATYYFVPNKNRTQQYAYSDNSTDRAEIEAYINKFLPSQSGDGRKVDGNFISILKKDGTWDLVCELPPQYGVPLQMSDFSFHFDADEYARTAEGYLRARLAQGEQQPSGYVYKLKFFVIDYLPQKIELKWKNMDNELQAMSSNEIITNKVRLYFSNIEGANRVILERKRVGALVPSKTTIMDFKKGYYDTTVDRAVTFTAVAYNDNGHTRGVPITISPVSTQNNSRDNGIVFSLENEVISIVSSTEDDSFEYSISKIEGNSAGTKLSGETHKDIDVAGLTDGCYILNVKSLSTGETKSYKFIR